MATKRTASGIIRHAKKAFQNADMLWDHDPIQQDGPTLEIKLRPDRPLAICDHYNDMVHRVSNIANAIDATPFTGSGHWHFSLMQNQDNLLVSNLHVRYSIASSLVLFQKIYPAFFVKPHIAEENFKSYRGAKSFYYDKAHWNTSVRFNTILLTLEPRLADHAPYQPVYLTMAAIQYGLVYPLPDPDFETPPPSFITGRFGYMDMLETTRRNIDEAGMLPRDLAMALLDNSVARYRAYLDFPRKQEPYTPTEHASIMARLSALHLPSEISLPQALPYPHAA